MGHKLRQNSFVHMWSAFKQNLMEFCENTSLHAVRHFTGDKSYTLKKIFFGFSFFFSFAFCIYLSILQVIEYQETVTITTLTTTAYPIWKVPFPSVIICNFNIVSKNGVKTILDLLKPYKINESIFDDIIMNLSSLITFDPLDEAKAHTYEQIYEIIHTFYTTDKMMAKLAQPCSQMLKECFWQSKKIKCTQYFKRVKTSDGFCCAFNYDGMFDISDLVDREPTNQSIYVGGAGSALGLRVVLDLEEDQYKSVIKPVYGFNVVVQDPKDFAEMDLIRYTLEGAEELTLSVTPKVLASSSDVRKLDTETRHCFFKDEDEVGWSNHYSYQTCTSKCKADTIFQLCKCWPFYYPLLEPKRICSLLDVPCLNNYSSLNDIGFIAQGDQLSSTSQCKCYPQCEKITYDLHSDRNKVTPLHHYYDTNYSILNVYYDTMGCQKIESGLYNSWDRSLASIGGIVGLCLGGSIITILEIIFFVCKWLIAVYKHNVRKNTVQQRKVNQAPVYIHDFKLYTIKTQMHK